MTQNKEQWCIDALDILGAKYLRYELKKDMVIHKAVEYNIPLEYVEGFLKGVSSGAASNLIFRQNVIETPVKANVAELHERMRRDCAEFKNNAWTKDLPVTCLSQSGEPPGTSTVKEYFGSQMPAGLQDVVDEVYAELGKVTAKNEK